jgi:hypothetical protein
VNLFCKAAKILSKSDPHQLSKPAASLLKALEAACEKDKSMANLKGKISEIKTIVRTA